MAALLLAGAGSALKATPLTSIVSSPTNTEIRLDPIANLAGFVPIDAASLPGQQTLYVATYVASSASVRVVDPVTKTVSSTPFLNFASTSVPISGQGLQGITFSPNFNDNTKPGYRKFYTFQAESGPGAANIMFLHPEVSAPGTVGVLREWTANSAGTAIDTSIASRIVLNFGTPGGHMGGGLKFGPDGYLYLATGDGGGNGNGGSTTSSTDGFTGRDPTGTASDVPGVSNAQDFTNALGKVLRVDPYVTNADGSPRATPANSTTKSFGGATRYFIPNSNPFVGNPQNIFFTPTGPAASTTPVAPLPELFSFGFRNPWKLSFDRTAAPGAAPYVADVGSRHREEIVLAQGGDNFGWPYREGENATPAATGRPLTSGNVPFLKQTSPGVYAPFDLNPALSNPAQMSQPIALLGTRSGTGSPLLFADRPGSDIDSDGLFGTMHGDGNAVTGGFVYRGSAIPALVGKYVFGIYQQLELDPAQDPSLYRAISGGGRLMYFDPLEAAAYKTIREFTFSLGFGIADAYIPGSSNNIGDLMGVVEGGDGELYAMFLNGDIKKIAAPILAGDYNQNGMVDAADYTVWRDAAGTSSVLPNDLIGGLLGAAHYTQWATNFGGTSATAAAQAIPEPATCGLAILGVALLVRRRTKTPSDG